MQEACAFVTQTQHRGVFAGPCVQSDGLCTAQRERVAAVNQPERPWAQQAMLGPKQFLLLI